MSTTAVGTEQVYLTNVWRLLFEATREETGWVAFTDPARFSRIAQMGQESGHDIQKDLDSAQAAVDAGMKPDEWKASLS